MKKILVILICLLSNYTIYSQNKNYNYTFTQVMRKPVVYEYYNSFDVSDTNVNNSITYYSRFGTPIQQIAVRAGGDYSDLVKPIIYDNSGKIKKDLLPYTKANTNAQFVSGAENEQNSYYSNQIAYSEVEYDNTPYNSIIKKSMVGFDINTVNVNRDEELNSEYEVVFWWCDENGNLRSSPIGIINNLPSKAYHAANTLIKQKNVDEKGHEYFTYTDNYGRILLTRSYVEDNTTTTGEIKTSSASKSMITVDRYMVYDESNLLRYEITPQAASLLTGNNYSFDNPIIKQYCTYYAYDSKNRIVYKRTPGAEHITYSYDEKDRLQAVQDGNMRKKGEWLCNVYDDFDRVSAKFIYKNSIIVPDVTISTFEKSSYFLNYSYFDDYTFLTGTDTTKYKFRPIEDIDNFIENSEFKKSDKILSKTTGTKVRVLNDTKWLTLVIYYDRFGRVIQTVGDNISGGMDIISTCYDEMGRTLNVYSIHTDKNNTQTTLLYGYDYYSNDKPKSTTLTVNGTERYLLNKFTYDNLGRVVKKEVGINKQFPTKYLQTFDYTYNIRGQLKAVNNPDELGNDVFAMRFYYDEVNTVIGNTPQYDGNISAIEWNSALQKSFNVGKTSYKYEYDAMGRMTQSIFAPEGRYNETVTYDLNSNITSLKRTGLMSNSFAKSIWYGNIDDLLYIYEGNKLLNVFEAAKDRDAQGMHFVQRSLLENQTYTYDDNGNLLYDYVRGANFKYNYLNLVEDITFEGNNRIKNTYIGETKVKQEYYTNGVLSKEVTYDGAFVYENGNLAYINHPEGRIEIKNGSYSDKYYVKDHLGNIRVVFGQQTASNAYGCSVWQENHYYAYGTPITYNGFPNWDYQNQFKFQGKELINAYNLNLYDFGARMYDPVLGRWFVQDPANQFDSPYDYCGGNPVNRIDPDGKFVPILIGMAVGAIIGGYSAYKNGARGEELLFNIFGGAILGGLSGGIGMGVSASVSAFFNTSFLGGFTGGFAGGFAGGAIAGAGGAWMNGASLGGGMMSGLRGGLVGGFIGGLTNGFIQESNKNKQLSLFRKGCYDLGVGENDPVPATDEFLLKSQKAWYKNAPMKYVRQMTVENVPQSIKNQLIENQAFAKTTAQQFVKEGILSGNSKIYFNSEMAFKSAKTLYTTMGHEFVHVSQIALLAGNSSSILTSDFVGLMEYHAYQYQNTLSPVNLNSFSDDLVRWSSNPYFEKMNYINFQWTNETNTFFYPFD